MRHFTVSKILVLMLVCTPAHAMTEAQIVHAVLGEARGCSAFEQEAIARATLNRGHLGGVYGYKADISNVGAKTRQIALKATRNAYYRDITGGADHWLSEWDLKHCRPSLIAWRHKMKITLKTKNFTFYK